MKTLYIECGMGAAGDMLTASLLELLPDGEAFLEKMNGMGLDGVSFQRETTVKCGITGTHIKVLVRGKEELAEDVHEHSHGQEHSHGHAHDQEHGHGHAHDQEHSHGHAHDQEHSHGHAHDQEHSHGHAHDQEHVHEHGHGQEHSHEHSHGQEHSHGHTHAHSSLGDITELVKGLAIEDQVKEHVIAVYRLIAEAESHAHGKPVEEIHFHEVGSLDAVADITAVCMLLEELKPDRIVVSPIHVGKGYVHCAHGILPVPAPATAHILQGVPVYSGSVNGELCTPTGAALLKHFATEFGNMPLMRTEKIGYGMGRKDFERANCVRCFLGETQDEKESIYELECNVDDMTGEEIGYCIEQLFRDGAVEAFTVPVNMKKSRPGILLWVICREQDREKVVRSIFRNTSTLGIREKICSRYTLDRKIEERETAFGKLHVKKSSGYGVNREKYEYEDLAGVARERGISLAEIKRKLGISKF